MSASWRTPRGAWAGGLLALTICGPSSADLPSSLTIKGDGRERGETPIIVESKGPLKPGTYVLTSDDGRTARAATVFQDAGKTYLGTILEKIPAQGSIALKVPDAPTPESSGTGVEMIPNGKRIKVQVDGKPPHRVRPRRWPHALLFPPDRPDRRVDDPGLPDEEGRGGEVRPPAPSVALVHPRGG